ncbi:MAG TPA: hypothetical protein VHE78_00410 [Gemmatimonadaceae bacterium]|nr:hypothetical protein [Gemmatimonadaceae bacterium]
MKSILKLVAIGAITAFASTAYAQHHPPRTPPPPPPPTPAPSPHPPHHPNPNHSDVTGPHHAIDAFAPVGSALSSPTAAPTVTATAQAFTSGFAQVSPTMGGAIAPAAVLDVGTLIASGSPQSEAAVGAALTARGAPAREAQALVHAMAKLAAVNEASAPSAILTAARAYNGLVANAPTGFFTSNGGQPPAVFLAIHAALTPMIQSIAR